MQSTSKPTAIDCQSFAGGFSLGVVQAGFNLIAKREYPGGFGSPAMLANRHLLGDFEFQEAEPDQWEPRPADLVFGNPPCSGFSSRGTVVWYKDEHGVRRSKDIRSENSSINDCMYALVRYAARCNPQVIVFESVQGAFTRGRDLMQDLRADLEARTGTFWNLYHVLHNVTDLGGAQIRKRYFWVASRIPFGVDPMQHEPVTVRDRIGDLENVELGSLDGHNIDWTDGQQRIHELATRFDWPEHDRSGPVYARAVEAGVELDHWNGGLVTDKGDTQFSPRRLVYDAPSCVLTGDAPWKIVHPTQPRTLTHREIARLSGFPDDWSCTEYMAKRKNNYWWGKGICVEAGQWIAAAARDAISGSPQQYQGELIGDREYLIDASKPPTFTGELIPLFDVVEEWPEKMFEKSA